MGILIGLCRPSLLPVDGSWYVFFILPKNCSTKIQASQDSDCPSAKIRTNKYVLPEISNAALEIALSLLHSLIEGPGPCMDLSLQHFSRYMYETRECLPLQS